MVTLWVGSKKLLSVYFLFDTQRAIVIGTKLLMQRPKEGILIF